MKERLSALCLILFLLFTGIGQIAATPPFEGLDEAAHYSSIRQIAGLGSVPLLGSGFLDQAFVDYRSKGPVPYAPAFPHDRNDGLTYRTFFENPALFAPYAALYRAPGVFPLFVASKELNWEVQHPPLYYLLLGAAAKATQGLSFADQFFVLRLISYLMAVAGLLIGLAGTLRLMKERYETTPILVPEEVCPLDRESKAENWKRVFLPNWATRLPETFLRFYLRKDREQLFPPRDTAGSVLSLSSPQARRATLFAFLLYPLIVPQFFPEFARLGNDSLCLLIMGIAWPLMLRWATADVRHYKPAFMLGLALALGLLTKGLFLPVAAGLGALILYRLWQNRDDGKRQIEQADNAVILFLPTLPAFFWYLYKWKATGSFLGHTEYATLGRGGDFVSLFLSNVTPGKLFGEFVMIPITFIWGGTASLVRPYTFSLMPMMLLFGWLIVRYLRALSGAGKSDLRTLPVWLTVPFLLGLGYHVAAMIALGNCGSTPGWYLNMLAPVFAFAFAQAFLSFGKSRLRQRLFTLFCWFGAGFLLWALWAQMPLYAGLAGEDTNRLILFSHFPFNLPEIAEITRRLQILVWPKAALAFFGTGIVFLLGGLALLPSFGAPQETQRR